MYSYSKYCSFKKTHEMVMYLHSLFHNAWIKYVKYLRGDTENKFFAEFAEILHLILIPILVFCTYQPEIPMHNAISMTVKDSVLICMTTTDMLIITQPSATNVFF